MFVYTILVITLPVNVSFSESVARALKKECVRKVTRHCHQISHEMEQIASDDGC